MKNIILASLLLILSLACQKDKKAEPDSVSGSLEHIEIGAVLPFLPLDTYASHSQVVFVNEEGQEKELTVSVSESVEEKLVNSISYTVEEISILYRDPQNDHYSISVIGSGNYSSATEYNLFVMAVINQFQVPNSSIMGINIEGESLNAFFYEEKTLLGRSFSAVYSNMFPPGELNKFGELYFNSEYGIIGFKDENGGLYVFKEFRG